MVVAAVAFYGNAPEESVLRRVNAPVLGPYGEDDDAVVDSVPATVATMRQSGKRFEVFRYMGATHSFRRYQVEGLNMPATKDAWPRVRSPAVRSSPSFTRSHGRRCRPPAARRRCFVLAWVMYPERVVRAPVVFLAGDGLRADAWTRAVSDQLAAEDFLVVVPDILTEVDPQGRRYEAAPAVQRDEVEVERRFAAVKPPGRWALTLPQARGKTGSIGFCAGGGNSFRLAAEVPEHDAAVVFYGTPPPEDEMAKINAPVVGFYGENDARVTRRWNRRRRRCRGWASSTRPMCIPRSRTRSCCSRTWETTRPLLPMRGRARWRSTASTFAECATIQARCAHISRHSSLPGPSWSPPGRPPSPRWPPVRQGSPRAATRRASPAVTSRSRCPTAVMNLTFTRSEAAVIDQNAGSGRSRRVRNRHAPRPFPSSSFRQPIANSSTYCELAWYRTCRDTPCR
jgi:dienelactone hydrolase